MHDGSAAAVPAGDPMSETIRNYERPLMGYALSLLRDAESARDVVQDTFLKLHEQPPRHSGPALKSWLFAVCRNRAFDVLRKEKRMVPLEQPTLESLQHESRSPAEEVEFRETERTAMRLLERLPENQREVIRLRFQNNMSYREISEITSLSVGNVGFLMHTGLKRLRNLMTD